MWRSIQEQTGTALDVGELLDKAKMDYRGMMHLGNWAASGKSTSVIPRKNGYEKDKSALLATSKTQAKHISKLTNTVAKAKDAHKSFLSLTGNGTKPNKTPNGSNQNSHSWAMQFGPGKEFSDKPEFSTWCHRQPIDGSVRCKKII